MLKKINKLLCFGVLSIFALVFGFSVFSRPVSKVNAAGDSPAASYHYDMPYVPTIFGQSPWKFETIPYNALYYLYPTFYTFTFSYNITGGGSYNPHVDVVGWNMIQGTTQQNVEVDLLSSWGDVYIYNTSWSDSQMINLPQGAEFPLNPYARINTTFTDLTKLSYHLGTAISMYGKSDDNYWDNPPTGRVQMYRTWYEISFYFGSSSEDTEPYIIYLRYPYVMPIYMFESMPISNQVGGVVYRSFNISSRDLSDRYSYDKGFNDGEIAGIDFADKRINVSSASYISGYNQGLNSGSNSLIPTYIRSIADVPFDFLGNLFDFEILGYNMKPLVFSILTGLVVIIVLKLLL